MSEMIRKHILFYGRVQGVGFRYHATYKASLLGLTGWVRNLEDGRVERVVEEIRECFCVLVLHLYHQRFIRIDEMQEQKIPLKDEREFRERW